MQESDGQLVLGNVTLPVGRKLNRSSGEGGLFLGPLGVPYIESTLSPSNLDKFEGRFL
jgi:hypothetical protein